MEKYKNEEYLKSRIMEDSGHLFVYGYKNDHRTKFLKSLESVFPVKPDSDQPSAIYLDSFALSKIDSESNDKDKRLIQTVSKEYLSFSIALRILEKALDAGDTIIDSKLFRLVESMNTCRNAGSPEIKTANQLLQEIKSSRDFYYENYIKYIKGQIEIIPIDDVSIPFLELNMFVDHYKDTINLDSYLGIILDKKEDQAVSSTRAVNNLLSSRINKDISVKVAMEPDAWETYTDERGQIVENPHDYSIIELDDSYREHMIRLM